MTSFDSFLNDSMLKEKVVESEIKKEEEFNPSISFKTMYSFGFISPKHYYTKSAINVV